MTVAHAVSNSMPEEHTTQQTYKLGRDVPHLQPEVVALGCLTANQVLSSQQNLTSKIHA